jgi:hypothetical protein
MRYEVRETVNVNRSRRCSLPKENHSKDNLKNELRIYPSLFYKWKEGRKERTNKYFLKSIMQK